MLAAAASRPGDFLTLGVDLLPGTHAVNREAQADAFAELSALVAGSPGDVTRRAVEMARQLCHAGSAGLSLMRPGGTLHWSVVGGALAAYEGTPTPREASPCGSCLDVKATVLIARPERVFAYLGETRPQIVEDLIVPLFDAAQPLGTFWVVHHDDTARFSAADAHVMQQLALQVSVSLRLTQFRKERRLLMRSHQTSRRALTRELDAERSRRMAFEVSETALQVALADKETSVSEAHHRVKNTLQIVSSLLSLQSRTSRSAEVRLALQQSQARLQILSKAHELLYREADDVREIPMTTLLAEVGEALRQSFIYTGVSLQVSADDISLAPTYAIPMALLVNEIVTNAYKHAFEGRPGAIEVQLLNTPDDGLLLRIADDGIGMQVNEGAHGLGMKLIRSFAARLDGKFAFAPPASGTGTVFTLSVGAAAKAALASHH